ncbi:MAG: VOC family protein [Vibrionaceae bacterium]
MSKNNEKLTTESLHRDLADFSVKIEKLIDMLGLDLTPFQADHIALRVNDWQQAKVLEEQWCIEGKWLSKNQINGRPICAIGLNKPLQLSSWSIECVELPYPGEKVYPKEGWQHVEWVVPLQACTPQDFFEQLLAHFPALSERLSAAKEQGVTVKLSMPEAQDEEHCNPTVAFNFDDVAIKLHPCSLEALCQNGK